MKLNSFAKFAWFTLAYNLAVILWGAVVRATGSGAGCGSHWPFCNGQVIPLAPRLETLIEFIHRLSSGLSLVLVAALFVWALRRYPRGAPPRLGAALSMVFILSEALVGAGLVLFGWVANDDSASRTVVISIHLVNTFLLLASLTLTAWWASHQHAGGPLSLRGQGTLMAALGVGLLAVLFIGMSGAITALGDTLFPAGTLAEGIRQDLDPNAHFLLRLRVIHPIIAVSSGFYLLFIAGLVSLFRPALWVRRFAGALGVLFVLQLAAGVLNLVLLAPVWLQLVHLLLADLVWITLVLFSAASLSESPAKEAAGSLLPDRKTTL
ncbi:MAG: heme A synthase [Chloroflexota bacterium]|nr:MAG: heme A synthase [Chloroflexota bacterium]